MYTAKFSIYNIKVILKLTGRKKYPQIGAYSIYNCDLDAYTNH